MYMYVYVCMYVFTIDTKLLVIVCIFFLGVSRCKESQDMDEKERGSQI